MEAPDAAAGLALLQDGTHDDFLVPRFLRPRARVGIGQSLVGRAHAAIDISDGLVADLCKLLEASGAGGELDIDKVPRSAALLERFDADSAERYALTGGDDYELCFTAPADAVAGIEGITAIGNVTGSDELVCRKGDRIVPVDDSGYRHFA